MVIVITLQGKVVHNGIAFDVSGCSAFFHNNRRSVEVDTVVDDKQRVVIVDNIVVDTNTVQILLEQVLEEEVLLFKSGLLFLNGKLVKVDLVVAFVEVV